ncbi:hypothetical protein V492_00235 [Pseudogymnoascus sp. VKM F-4246]|nr:hypothetical protein V492_00235 [Pseudogymnoascus sp. VKM F-4246]
MESTDQNADYSVIQNHPQTNIETDDAMPNDARSGEASEILLPSGEGRSLPGVIDLTAQPDSIQYIGEDTRITQLRALYKTFRDIRQNSFLSSATISNDLLDILPLMMEGAVQYAGQLRVDNKTLQERTNWFEAENKKLYRRADVLQSNLNYIEHALAGVKATSRDLEKAVTKELRRNEFLKIENSRLEKGLRDVMSAKRGSTEGSEKDEPRRPIPALISAAPFEEENNLILATDPIETSVGSSSARIGREVLQWDVLILKHFSAIESGSTRNQSI